MVYFLNCDFCCRVFLLLVLPNPDGFSDQNPAMDQFDVVPPRGAASRARV